MAETRAGLARKVGPLPLWAWGILGGIAVYFLYVRHKTGSSAGITNSPTATVLDPNQVDPTTGLTYGQELAGSYPTGGGLQASAPGPTSSTPAGSSGGSLADQFNAFDTDLLSFLGAQQDFGQLAGALGYSPPNPSQATTTAATSPAVQNTSQPGAGNRVPVGTKLAGGALVAPYGHNKPAGLPGYKTVGTGSGGWEYVPNKTGHGQKTMHVANPANHQTQVNKPKSNARPAPVKHPAAGSHPGKVNSGSHDRATPSSTPHPAPPKQVARNPAPVKHPAPPPPPKKAPPKPPKPPKTRR